jgi:hypothetical protein
MNNDYEVINLAQCALLYKELIAESFHNAYNQENRKIMHWNCLGDSYFFVMNAGNLAG